MLARICDSFIYQSHSSVGQSYVYWTPIDPGSV